MTEKTRVDWYVEQDEVVLRLELRMSGHWFIERARQIYQVLQPATPPPRPAAERLRDSIPPPPDPQK